MDNTSNQAQEEQEQLVAEWLLATPGFFNRHPELLTQIELANSHSGKAISLQEKQMAVLRNQNRDLNQRLSEMLRFGTENDRTQTLMIGWLEDLLVSVDRQTTTLSITAGLNQLFEIPKVNVMAITEVADDLKLRLEEGPICGAVELVSELVDAEYLIAHGSVVLIRLCYADSDQGVLVLASPDAHKFSAQMGLHYVCQLAQLAAAALYRFRDA